MTDSPDWDDLLDKSRGTADRAMFTPYIAELCREETLSDDMKMRLLGNAVRNSPENQAIVLDHKDFVNSLLTPFVLPLTVLYNLCVGNPTAAEYIASQEEPLVAALSEERGPGCMNLLGVLFQELNEFPLSLSRQLVLDGQLLEVLEIDPKLAMDEELIKKFDDVFAIAVSYPDQDAAITAITAITCNENFGLEAAKNIPLTSSVVFALVLANLTGKLEAMDSVLVHWPNAIDTILQMFSDDGQEDANLNFAAYFLRNVARDSKLASELWEKGIYKVVEYLSEDEEDCELLLQLAGHLLAVKYDQRVVDLLFDEEADYSPERVLALSRAAQGLTSLANVEEHKDTAEKIAGALTDLLHQTPASLPQTMPLWVKGSKALAQLSRVVPVEIDELESEGPDNEAVRANFQAARSPSKNLTST
ncbi:hypothetical protein B9G98_00989 [Wickerhamiella sorbophila]|uniref:Uncharacterized protein n=1 Tax=Wickerhamiella sorbophila TaxID=45607 RepID=A0A2T0FEI5_9ASCO|nr:hypothetical protein B9G98_00989 [Wickerhamiella sorbophila]PRT53369.1 hypothetical protein B9G98_00989 [Wickerhamiella sorbophila]